MTQEQSTPKEKEDAFNRFIISEYLKYGSVDEVFRRNDYNLPISYPGVQRLLDKWGIVKAAGPNTLLTEALIDGKKAQSVKCRLQAGGEAELPEYEGAAASCDVKTIIEPAGDWDNILAVPGGVYLPWSQVKETLNMALRISYTDVDFKPNDEVKPKQG